MEYPITDFYLSANFSATNKIINGSKVLFTREKHYRSLIISGFSVNIEEFGRISIELFNFTYRKSMPFKHKRHLLIF